MNENAIHAGAMIFVNGTPYRLLWKLESQTSKVFQYWRAQPLFVDEDERMIAIGEHDRITRIHTQHA